MTLNLSSWPPCSLNSTTCSASTKRRTALVRRSFCAATSTAPPTRPWSISWGAAPFSTKVRKKHKRRSELQSSRRVPCNLRPVSEAHFSNCTSALRTNPKAAQLSVPKWNEFAGAAVCVQGVIIWAAVDFLQVWKWNKCPAREAKQACIVRSLPPSSRRPLRSTAIAFLTKVMLLLPNELLLTVKRLCAEILTLIYYSCVLGAIEYECMCLWAYVILRNFVTFAHYWK